MSLSNHPRVAALHALEAAGDEPAFVSALADLAHDLAADQPLRAQIGASAPPVWPWLHELWVRAERATRGADSGSDQARAFALAVARFTRNLVAETPGNQLHAYENEPLVQTILTRYTSFAEMDGGKSVLLTRYLTQSLANLVTGNEPLLGAFWAAQLAQTERDGVILRLLSSPDLRTIISVLVLVLNCTHESAERLRLLASEGAGPRIVIALLDKIEALSVHEDEQLEEFRAFAIGYSIFTRLIAARQIPTLYENISVQEEVTTPHQTILLKLLDSYLHSSTTAVPPDIYQSLTVFLVALFLSLSSSAQSAVTRSLGPAAAPATAPAADAPPPPLEELDLRLPKICEALVLVSRCLIGISLHTAEADVSAALAGAVRTPMAAPSSADKQGLVESLIELLRLLDLFVPRITLGRVVPSPALSRVPGHGQHGTASADPTGFQYVKRDLVRLLGLIAHESKEVQDRVRLCGGIPVVMNLCVVDDRNPYLREHAILTLRNLLHGNAENQAVVDAVKPMGHWDEDGVLRDAPGAVRR